jgi:hypothetical protein
MGRHYYIKTTGVSNFIPKEYVDTCLPLHEKGDKYFPDDDDLYWHWLADHLYKTDIPLPDSQRLYLEKNNRLSFKDILWRMAYELFGTHSLDNIYDPFFDGLLSFEELNEMQLECYEAGLKDAEDNEEEPPTKEDYLFTKEEYERLMYEYNQSPPYEEYTNDMPYRPIMAHFIKQIQDHDERYKLLKYFDDECEEQAWDWYK